MFDLNEIKQRSESRSYQLGEKLYYLGKVSRLSVTADSATAIVSGQHDYHVSLYKDDSIQGETLQISCSCPAAAYQDICKHAVAVALLVENTSETEFVNEDEKQIELINWFKQKPVDELTDILMAYIDDSTNELDKWQLIMRSEENNVSISELSKLITKALPAKSVWEWNKVSDYFAHANEMFDPLFKMIEKLSTVNQWKLILKAIQRLNKVLEQIDDSGGFRFYIEGELNQRLVDLFNLLPWSDEKKAQWIFSHTEEYKYDVFPNVPEDFELSPEVKQLFLAQCLKMVEQKAQAGDLNDREHKWSIRRLSKPLIDEAKEKGDWQAQCRFMQITAVRYSDYLDIAGVCLENNEALEGEYWLQQAYKAAQTSYEKRECQAYEVKIRVALSEFKSAWQLAWQMFSDTPSFTRYQNLLILQEQTGVIDVQFIEKTEQILADCYIETERGLATNSDALLDFYIDRKELDKARVWALAHKANSDSLLELANLIIALHPDDTVALYRRVVCLIIEQTNNSAYQEAIDLLLKLENMLKENKAELRGFYQMVTQIGQAYKQKRNMLKLLKEHFAYCF
ncbi:SWIM zinc finger family protein [Psychromonas sp. PT13]|uniref:SWIM zinc finger family protein n=1 Tax=Psychromonas sp. PT13 TaxID=3439547 RepID=UPI003EBA3F15